MYIFMYFLLIKTIITLVIWITFDNTFLFSAHMQNLVIVKNTNIAAFFSVCNALNPIKKRFLLGNRLSTEEETINYCCYTK